MQVTCTEPLTGPECSRACRLPNFLGIMRANSHLRCRTAVCLWRCARGSRRSRSCRPALSPRANPRTHCRQYRKSRSQAPYPMLAGFGIEFAEVLALLQPSVDSASGRHVLHMLDLAQAVPLSQEAADQVSPLVGAVLVPIGCGLLFAVISARVIAVDMSLISTSHACSSRTVNIYNDLSRPGGRYAARKRWRLRA